jgi:TPR repeat protein
MHNLALLYQTGLGVEKDDAKARLWFENAAGQGNTRAMFQIGLLYQDGRGVEKDYTKARQLYDRVVDMFHDTQPALEVDKMYLKLSYFYRADCIYDLGQYAEAIKLYDTAAGRYQEDPATLAAYVQIVNAYVAPRNGPCPAPTCAQ